jgi:tetratricopeptide (TPR) repeat protein
VIAFFATLHQKRIAERRFDQVRSLARAVVFELHDAIAPLPGSTPARELLVRRALVYLDNLATESDDNTPLRIELAGAYLKIGDVQGLPYRANLGDTAGALRSYQKALGIARAVREDDAEDVEARRLLADAHDRIGFVQQRALKWDQAFAHHEEARVLRETLPPSDERDVALARTWTAIGDSRYIGRFPGSPRKDYEAALAAASRVPASSKVRRDALMERGRAHQHLGGYFTGLNERDLTAAIRHHDAALRDLGEHAALDPGDSVARRNYADQYVMKATAQVVAGDAAGALASTEKALEVLRVLAAADPKNVEAQHDLAFAYSEQGRALVELKRFAEAEIALERAKALHERRLADDPHSAEDRRDLSRVNQMLDEVRKNAR